MEDNREEDSERRRNFIDMYKFELGFRKSYQEKLETGPDSF